MMSLAYRVLTSPLASAVSLVAVERVNPRMRNRIIQLGWEMGKVGFVFGMVYGIETLPQGIKSMNDRDVRAVLYVMAESVRTAIEAGAAAMNILSLEALYYHFYPEG